MRRFDLIGLKRLSIRKFAFAVLLSACTASAAKASFIFGSFEDQQPDGFGYFGNSGPVQPFSAAPSTIHYSYSTNGATDGIYSLDLNSAGYTQNDLGYDFVASGDAAQFMANDVLSFTMVAPVSSTGSGYFQIYSVALNAPGAGFQNIGGSAPVLNQYPPYSGQVNTFSFNYDAYKAAISANPGYLQMVITTNQGGGAPQDFYLDDFKLSSVPEPASFSILGLAAAGLMGRRRRSRS